MTNPRVLCIGEMLFDRLSNEPGRSLEQVTSWTDYEGGAPANVACALVKLGTSSGFIGCIGQDTSGQKLVEVLKEVGVDQTGVQRHPTAPTRIVYVVRDSEGDRTFAGFGDYDTTEFADTRLQANQLPVVLFEEAAFLVLGTLSLAYPDSREAITLALSLAQKNGVKIFVDVNWRENFWPDPSVADQPIQELVQQADFLKLNDKEAKKLFGTADPKAIAQRLNKAKGVFVTAGKQGCAYYLEGGNAGKLPARSVTVEDTTGAGDAFTAGLLHQLCQQGIANLTTLDAKELVTYASAVGALTTMKPGAIKAQPNAAEVEAFLVHH